MGKQDIVVPLSSAAKEAGSRKGRGLVKTAVMLNSGGNLPNIPVRTAAFIKEVLEFGIDKTPDFGVFLTNRRRRQVLPGLSEYMEDFDTYLSENISHEALAKRKSVSPSVMMRRLHIIRDLLRDGLIASTPEYLQEQKRAFYEILPLRMMTSQDQAREMFAHHARRRSTVPTRVSSKVPASWDLRAKIAEQVMAMVKRGLSFSKIAEALGGESAGISKDYAWKLHRAYERRQKEIMALSQKDRLRLENGLTNIRRQVETGTFFHPNIDVYSFIRDAIALDLDRNVAELPMNPATWKNLPSLLENFDLVMGGSIDIPTLAKRANVSIERFHHQIKQLYEIFLGQMPKDLQDVYSQKHLVFPGHQINRQRKGEPGQLELWNTLYLQKAKTDALSRVTNAWSRQQPGIAIFTFQVPAFWEPKDLSGIKNPRVGFVTKDIELMADIHKISHQAQDVVASVVKTVTNNPGTPSSQNRDLTEISESNSQDGRGFRDMRRVVIAIETSRTRLIDREGSLQVINLQGKELGVSKEIVAVIEQLTQTQEE